MTDSNPWAQMVASSQRRIDSGTTHDLFWIKDHIGNYGFCLQSKSKLSIDENAVNLRGITIIKRNMNQNTIELFLVLNKKEEWEIFLALCDDLVAVAKKYTSSIQMINAVENRMKRWKELLKQERKTDFTREQQMGLFSELLCLRDFIAPRTSFAQAVHAWGGPESDKQDFMLDDIAVEVKSHSTSKGNYAYISSTHQLSCEKEPLYLFSYALTASENGQSVEDVSQSIKELIDAESAEIVEIFEYKLIEYGYIPEIIREPLLKLVLDKLRVFHVSDGFPKITPTDVKPQIVSLKYAIDLSQCTEFVVNIESL